MNARIAHKTADNKGFSLVELIIVIAIMAVLTALLAPQFLKYVEKSREARDNTNIALVLRTIQVSLVEETVYNQVYSQATNDPNKVSTVRYLDSGKLQCSSEILAHELAAAFGVDKSTISGDDASIYIPPLLSKEYNKDAGDGNNWVQFAIVFDDDKATILKYVNWYHGM